MILGYSLPRAEENILAEIKIHTIRLDKVNRWRPGVIIQHSKGVRSKDYRCFLENECKSVQSILIVLADAPGGGKKMIMTVDKRRLSDAEAAELAKNDGFNNLEDMKAWFFKEPNEQFYAGKIIHWTNKKY